MKLLYVDPDDGRRSRLERSLEDVTVVTAATAGDAATAVGERAVDCVVTEYDLGDGTGLELLETVREREPTLPVVVCTADGDERLASEAIAAGVTDYVIREADWVAHIERRLEAWTGVDDSVRDGSSPPGRTDAYLRSIFDHSPDLIAIHDAEGNILDVNQRACDQLGYDYEEFVELTIDDIEVGIDPDDLAAVWERYEYGEPITLEGRHRRRDGTEYPVEINLGKVRLADEDRFLAIARDVSEREAAKRKLEQREAHLRQAQSVADLGSWQRDVAADEIRWSEGVYDIFERDPAEGGLDHEAFMSYVHPEDEAFVEEAWQNALEGEPYDIEHRIVVDGETKWVRERADVEFEGAEPVRAIGVVQDVTERIRRERELERTNEQLRVLNRLVRHDIRNDMSVVIGWGEELESHVDEAGQPMLERLTETGRHVVDLTRTVRDFVAALERDGEAELDAVDLRRVLTAELESRRTAFPGVTFVVDEVPRVEVRADELLSSVFHNILNNAVQHTDSDEPRVEVRVQTDEETVTVRIADDGPGIPPSRREAVFGRTEDGLEHPAAGVGLYLVDTLLERYGGDVHVEDAKPELGGAAVVVELPRY